MVVGYLIQMKFTVEKGGLGELIGFRFYFNPVTSL